jgi:hypothetical protein
MQCNAERSQKTGYSKKTTTKRRRLEGKKAPDDAINTHNTPPPAVWESPQARDAPPIAVLLFSGTGESRNGNRKPRVVSLTPPNSNNITSELKHNIKSPSKNHRAGNSCARSVHTAAALKFFSSAVIVILAWVVLGQVASKGDDKML